MKRLLFPIITILLSLTAFTSCSNEDEPAIEQETGEILFETYVDGQLQDPASYATVNFTGGYATGAGKYTAYTEATVAAYPNSGYKLESFGCTALQHSGQASYYIEKVPVGVTTYKVKFKNETPTTGTLQIDINTDKGTITSLRFNAHKNGTSEFIEFNYSGNYPDTHTFSETLPAGTYLLSVVWVTGKDVEIPGNPHPIEKALHGSFHPISVTIQPGQTTFTTVVITD